MDLSKKIICSVCGVAFAAHAVGVPLGCVGYNVFTESACDPAKHARHDPHTHTEQATTSTTAADSVTMFTPTTNLAALAASGEPTLEWWRQLQRPVEEPPFIPDWIDAGDNWVPPHLEST